MQNPPQTQIMSEREKAMEFYEAMFGYSWYITSSFMKILVPYQSTMGIFSPNQGAYGPILLAMEFFRYVAGWSPQIDTHLSTSGVRGFTHRGGHHQNLAEKHLH